METLWYCLFLDSETIKNFALSFSKQHNIVESKDWANLILENGLDGGGNAGMRNPGIGGQKKGCTAWNKGMTFEYVKRPRKNPKEAGRNISNTKTKKNPIFNISNEDKKFLSSNCPDTPYLLSVLFNQTYNTNYKWGMFKSVFKAIKENRF